MQTDALREALRPKGGEDAVEYAERVEAALEGGYSFVGELYSGELRAVNEFGVSLALSRQEREEVAFCPGGDTFFPWGSVVRIMLAAA